MVGPLSKSFWREDALFWRRRCQLMEERCQRLERDLEKARDLAARMCAEHGTPPE